MMECECFPAFKFMVGQITILHANNIPAPSLTFEFIHPEFIANSNSTKTDFHVSTGCKMIVSSYVSMVLQW